MRTSFFIKPLFCLLGLVYCSIPTLAVKSPVDYVNPLVGTQSKFELSTGNTYPAIALPWGMNFWTPQTGKMGDGWVYTYTADKIRGFKQTHQPSPWMNDYGQFSIMPVTGKAVFDENQRASWFSHKAEVATPYYYKVYLADHDVTTELAPTERAAAFRFTFPESKHSYIVLDAFDRGSYVKVIPSEQKIIGYTTRNSGGVPSNFKNYFVLVFDKAFHSVSTVRNGKIESDSLSSTSNHSGAIVGFLTSKGEQINVKVASSFISFSQAEQNLKELGTSSFDEVVSKGRERWNSVLGRIDVEDSNVDHLRTFYSCLYRSVLFPRSFYEYDSHNRAIHYSPYNGKILPGYLFTDTGFWDTFRCLFPFLNLMYPSMNVKMQAGLVNAYKESGFLPEWASPGHRDCMVGNNSASIVADAYLKGLRGYDIETLWKALIHGTDHHLEGTASGRVAYQVYNNLGYVPDNIGIGQNVARTLEYAYDDWSIYRLGKELGKPESEIGIFKQRALNYRNVYDPEKKLMVGKSDQGVFNSNFAATDWSGDFCEGNSWHWSFCVFHDPQGLINLMGGNKEFNAMMDSVFIIPSKEGMKSRGMIHEMREMQVMNMGQYAHGNQPIQHMVYLYNYSGEPWKAQYWTREIMNKLYNAAPDGYCGDEDNGQTSAWYVFSALGFYPVCPGSNEYVLGSPLFKSVRLHLENGKTVQLEAPDNGAGNRYIKSLKVNGRMYDRNYLTQSQLLEGPTITYDMDSRPYKHRGVTKEDLPYSFSNEIQK
ncbi:MAG: GH92 family glycosyl hydrolase [Bacteroides sp.]|jgi:predicted alpha-1,2-mannosidase|nr:GH92 family glycosyl hydrolase [Bacteroides sp.]MCI1681570.1 GH92 family glycosyl hydrolase [Bacteroides sp.]